MESNNQLPKRRVRYSGTHPKTYEEKYKEHQPDKYAETVAKVISKGNTPAGMHRPIMVDEILDVLQVQKGKRGLDVTLGYGGHTEAILKILDHTGHLTALDADPLEIEKTTSRLRQLGYTEQDLTILNQNFADIAIPSGDEPKYDFILADLGVSSMQIDNPSRGFTFKQEGPLDLRMNPYEGIPAMYRLQAMSELEIIEMLENNADEPYASRIAKEIVSTIRSGKKLATTLELKNVIAKALPSLPLQERTDALQKSCQRVFQALRIEVNHELESLTSLLDKLPDLLAEGGRVAILSFHSGEDRLVKKAFQYYQRQGIFKEIAPEFQRPTFQEQTANPRAKSAKLRWAVK